MIAPAAAVSPAAAASPLAAASPAPAAKPAVAPSPSASPAVAASPSAVPVQPVASVPFKQMYQQDIRHSGRSQYTGPRQARLLRRFDMGAPENIPSDAATPRADVQSSSVIGPDGTIYISDFPGVLFALRDSATASDQLEAVWRFHPPTASSFHATPALSSDGSTIYLGFASGGFSGPSAATLYALNTASTGQAQVKWMADLGATRVMASPTVGPDGTVYVATSDGHLFAVASDGTARWSVQTGATIKSAPAVGADGTIYHATSDGNMYAVSPQGQIKWMFTFADHLGPTPLVIATPTAAGGGAGGGANGIGSGASPTIGNDGTIFIGANNSNMYAVTTDGNLKWLFEAQRELAGIWTTPALSADGSTIYFGANAGGIYALNTADGSKKWQFPVYGSIYASSTLDGQGSLYTGTTIEHLYAVNGTTGEQVWDFDVQNQVWCAPSLRSDGTLVIADRSGLVQVIG